MALKKTDETRANENTETKSVRFSCIPILGKTGGGIQWDPEKQCVLAEFDKNGEFETEDKDVIYKLRALGYKTSEEHEADVRQEDEFQRRNKTQGITKSISTENFSDVKARFQSTK